MSSFVNRHIGPTDSQSSEMLKTLGFSNLEEMASRVIPKLIRTKAEFKSLGEGMSEFELLKTLKKLMGKNKIHRNYMGLGFNESITPTVIQRNILENPVWYTAYTPYQAEISQGRMEALLNFQTMVTDLTGMEISNASLLDEGSAAAEAVVMAHSLSKTKSNTFLASPHLHPHVLEVLQTRSAPLGLKMLIQEPTEKSFDTSPFAVVVAYPDTTGDVKDFSKLADSAHQQGCFLIVAADLLSLSLLKPPGEWGADIVFGNSQRFGVPLGFGGPHAAFLATKNSFKRSMPGRLIGVSIDSQGNPALRLALQTREQHIRREKATSNICTAQVLLANMASMFAVYHGPKGITNIAKRIHSYTASLAHALRAAGFELLNPAFFDTLTIKANKEHTLAATAAAEEGIDLRFYSNGDIGISLNETTSIADLEVLVKILGGHKEKLFEGLKTFTHQDALAGIPAALVRKTPILTHPIFNSHHSETELLRYIHSLQNKDLSLTHSMIPLGSCTMKLNATTELVPLSWPEVGGLHPFTPITNAQGYLELIHDLEAKLCEITGFAGVSLQPNAGSQGEYAGLLVIREYHRSKNQAHRNICLIPSSAHGTNPASAVMAGMEVIVVACDTSGNVDLKDLAEKASQHKDHLAALMITYPSTHGVFEESIVEICKTIHSNGGQVYMDGANLNALVGLCRPGEFGPDVSHMNLHKTFAIPHGGGGPGVGPIGVAEHLKPFLPKHSLVKEVGPQTGITAVTSPPWGSASILTISWAYISLMGRGGLKQASLMAILNANYIAKKLEPYYPILYKGKEGLVAHECIIDLRELKKTSGIDVTDVAKRLMDYGFHAPTMSWPVPGTLMIEPTESESKAELDRFIEAMICIHKEISNVEKKIWPLEDNPLVNAPHTSSMLMKTEWKHPYSREIGGFPLPWVKQNKFWPSVGRVDNAYGDRNVVCSCPAVESYQK